MIFSLNIDKIGVKYKTTNFFREVSTFDTILKHPEGQEFYWLDFPFMFFNKKKIHFSLSSFQ